jgi:hypothetical protein
VLFSVYFDNKTIKWLTGLVSGFYRVSLYVKGTWELRFVLVMFNAKPYERDLPIYSKYVEGTQEPFDILDVHGRTTQSSGCIPGKVTTTPMFRDVEKFLYLKYIRLSKIYMILLLFPFIPLFESPQMDFLVKRYAEFKNAPLKTLIWRLLCCLTFYLT